MKKGSNAPPDRDELAKRLQLATEEYARREREARKRRRRRRRAAEVLR